MSDTPIPQDPETLVEQLADDERRWAAWTALNALGQAALPAVHEGLRHGKWQIRRWCAAFLDHHGTAESLERLTPLLHDPKSLVRLWAVHSISCDRCKDGENPIDVVPLLIERIEHDPSIRVRRMAAAMLATHEPDRRTVAAVRTVLREESDRKLRLHAEACLARSREVGLVGEE